MNYRIFSMKSMGVALTAGIMCLAMLTGCGEKEATITGREITAEEQQENARRQREALERMPPEMREQFREQLEMLPDAAPVSPDNTQGE